MVFFFLDSNKCLSMSGSTGVECWTPCTGEDACMVGAIGQLGLEPNVLDHLSQNITLSVKPLTGWDEPIQIRSTRKYPIQF